MPLISAGYWHTNYWVKDYWVTDYWTEYATTTYKLYWWNGAAWVQVTDLSIHIF